MAAKSLRVLDLFSGIGGMSLGLERTGGFRTVAFCEIEEFPRRVLRKHWPDVPIFEDVRTLRGADVGAIDVVVGGAPCQPFSVAGSQRGVGDERHLWPEMLRLIRECRPTWIIFENVPGIRTLAADLVCGDLEMEEYACWPLVVGADDVGAPHRRKRVWIVAHAGCGSLQSDGNPGKFPGSGRPNRREAQPRTVQAPPVCGGEAVPYSEELGRGQGGSGRPDPGGEGEREQPLQVSDASGERLEGSGPGKGTEPKREASRRGRVGDGSGVGNPDSERELQPGRLESDQWGRFGNAGWGFAQSSLGGGVDGLPKGLAGGGLNEKRHEDSLDGASKSSKSGSKAGRDGVFGMQIHRPTGEAPSYIRQPELDRDLVQAMPYQSGSDIWVQEIEDTKGVPDVWEDVYSEPLKEAHNLQPEVSVGVGQEECVKTMESWRDGTWEDGIPRVSRGESERVAKLKALGNSVVPQIVEVIGRAILSAQAAWLRGLIAKGKEA